MPVEPEPIEPEPTVPDRIQAVVRSAIPEPRRRPVIAIAIVAGLATLAPFPASAAAAFLLVIIAADSVRR